MAHKHSLINLKNVTIACGEISILQDISIDIYPGEITAIIGASGSGKTTLLKLIFGFLTQEKGWKITGEYDCFPGLRIASINQNPALQVFKNFVYEEFADLNKNEVAKLLQENDCTYLCEKRCLELSQGEKTIVAILRALSQNINLLVLDEVIVNLSVKRRNWLKGKIKDFKKRGGTVIIVEHASKLLDIADKIFLLQDKHAVLVDHETAISFLNKKNFNNCLAKPPIQVHQNHHNQNDGLIIENVVDDFISFSRKNPLNFLAQSGEIIGISGENGSGKSTLIEIICGIKRPSHRGKICWQQQEFKKMRDRKNLLIFITQESAQQFFTTTVQSELNLAQDSIDEVRANRLINLFQLNKLFGCKITALSYGEKQRLAMVCGMLADTKILLFDEPTYGMDNLTHECFAEACRTLAQQDKIIIIASHERQLLAELSNTIIYL